MLKGFPPMAVQCVEFVCYVCLGFSLMIVEVFVPVWLNQSSILSSCILKSLWPSSICWKKIIKHHLQNIPICSSSKRKKEKEEWKGSGMTIWAKTILFFSVRGFVFCYVSDCVTFRFLPPLPISNSLECDILLNLIAMALNSHAIWKIMDC